MKEFTFRVTQPLSGYYEGDVTIKAESEEQAREKLDSMTQEELEELDIDWTHGDEYSADGPITVEGLENEEDLEEEEDE